MLRPGPLLISLGFALAGALGARVAHAESASAPAAAAPATPAPLTEAQAQPAPSAKPALAGFTILASGGYGVSTASVRHMNLAPYGATFGLDAGFTFPFGLRLSAYGAYSLGKTTEEKRDPLIGRTIDFEAETSSLNAGLSFGWDVPLYFLVLRYGVGLGITSMSWDFGGVDASRVNYGDAENPNVGFHFAPGAAVLWPHGKFECGVGFDYFTQFNGTIPNGFVGKLLAGVKL
jgi:hypothetical protein